VKKSEDQKKVKVEVKNSKFKVQKVYGLGFGKNTDFHGLERITGFVENANCTD
jgi:hypothetical protein